MGPNEKKLRQIYAGFAAGRPELSANTLAEDVVWISAGAPNRLEMAGEWHGLAGVREYFRKLTEGWTLLRAVLEETITRDDERFAVHSQLTAVSNTTGKTITFRKIDLVTMKDGKITHCAETYDTSVAVRASRL